MSDLVRIETELGNGRTRVTYVQKHRLIPAARANGLSTPMVSSDALEREVRGPDGKIHTSKASLRASYKPSGNPMGKSYIEVGNEEFKPHVPKGPSDESIDASIKKALAKAGHV